MLERIVAMLVELARSSKTPEIGRGHGPGLGLGCPAWIRTLSGSVRARTETAASRA